MSNFEKLTASPEALGEFLASLPVAAGPWDGVFRKEFCDSCKRKNCDEKGCPHQDKRNNPTWWLRLGEQPGEALGLTIKVKAAFPIEFGKVYYTVDAKEKQTRAPCTCCDNTGKVTIKGIEYDCPRCKGNWKEKEVIGKTTVYSVAKWMLESVSATSTEEGTTLRLKRINGTRQNSRDTLDIRTVNADMKL